jgi:signal recognition particle subunit SRP54
MKAQLDQVDEKELDRVAAIIQSMTPAERNDPKLLNASRRTRIAQGSGTQVSDVNSLVERFGEAQKMMRGMRGGKGGMPAMPGTPGFGAGGGKKSKGRQGRTPAKSKKSRSGNPAKRAQQEAQAGLSTTVDGGAADMNSLELPDEVKKLLGGS